MQKEVSIYAIDREHDACGLFGCINKDGKASRMTIQMGIEALEALSHRSGRVQGEGDGCGVMIDTPHRLWASWLEHAGHDPTEVHSKDFAVLHLLVPDGLVLQQDVLAAFVAEVGGSVRHMREGAFTKDAWGPIAGEENPTFIQAALLLPHAKVPRLKGNLESALGVHVMSLSHDTVVYKVIGDGQTLWDTYPDLRDKRCVSSFCMSHTRYSTNTQTSFPRVQPFSVLGHNGEINTIQRFHAEASQIGASVSSEGSDSQMVNEVVESLVYDRGWSLFEVAELVFPPIIHEIAHMSPDMAEVYRFYRSLWGPFSQGPAAMVMRAGNEAIFTVDAMGLRPLWVVETKDVICASSEQGIIPAEQWTRNPRALSPGEKFGVLFTENGTRLLSYDALRQEVASRARKRYPALKHHQNKRIPERAHGVARPPLAKHRHIRAAAFGWTEDDLKLVQDHVRTGNEPIRSLGYDGPIGALRTGPRLIPDLLQETVAVVTNPAVDREREVEHFSTRVVLGSRPFMMESAEIRPTVELPSPLLLDALPTDTDVDVDTVQMLALRHNTLTYEDALWMLHDGPSATVEMFIHREEGESVEMSVARIVDEVTTAVTEGARAIVLDDRLQFRQGRHLDPFLVTSAVHQALASWFDESGEAVRRRASVLLRSSAVRNLHDVMVAVGLGADAVIPVMMWELAADSGGVQGLENLYNALCKGIEKVLSTLGIHELRGYEKLFSGIGLHPALADYIGVANALGGANTGLDFDGLEETSKVLEGIYEEDDSRILSRQKEFHIYPRVWRLAGQVAEGRMSYDDYAEKLDEFERQNPISIRHLLELIPPLRSADVSLDTVDASIDGHEYPLVISSMSFGSQGEVAYRSYAEAAHQLNIVAMNGEGGELKDLLTAYPRHRGRQVASGRFGVNAALCNHAYVLEIKIGQGAKPGEGGHLPGSKVTPLVASARNAVPGTDLISPSNHHDIYSIEDLEQVIYELRTVNPKARIAVKVPVVPNIGTIGVGIAKAGADVVVLSGFDGGTGAARAHALQRVGLPVEIGIRRVHESLCEAGLRNQVEIWADGGMKSAKDVMKAILLGANRVGFGSMAMVALGCTACRACHKDTCHVGIATQITTRDEAREKGLPRFEPREHAPAVQNLIRFFGTIGEEVKQWTARLGEVRTQNLVGRVDLLEQVSGFERLSCAELLLSNPVHQGAGSQIVIRAFEVEPSFQGARNNKVPESRFIGEEALSVAQGGGRDVQYVDTWGSTTRIQEDISQQGAAQSSSRHSVTLHPFISSSTVSSRKRALATSDSGAIVRSRAMSPEGQVPPEHQTLVAPEVAGNGFAAYLTPGIHATAIGGAQDGVAKGAFGGRIVVLKTRVADGRWVGGSVGKGLAYGAQHGLVIVQGDADARAGVRLSGADVVIGGEVTTVLQDELGFLAARSNVKGFAFEYMTAGRALVLGDAGPWICSGMTGGRVYLRLNPEVGLTPAALRRRLAKGAKVRLSVLDRQGEVDVENLLLAYHRELRHSGQTDAVRALTPLLLAPADHFMMVEPGAEQTDQDVATE